MRWSQRRWKSAFLPYACFEPDLPFHSCERRIRPSFVCLVSVALDDASPTKHDDMPLWRRDLALAKYFSEGRCNDLLELFILLVLVLLAYDVRFLPSRACVSVQTGKQQKHSQIASPCECALWRCSMVSWYSGSKWSLERHLSLSPRSLCAACLFWTPLASKKREKLLDCAHKGQRPELPCQVRGLSGEPLESI